MTPPSFSTTEVNVKLCSFLQISVWAKPLYSAKSQSSLPACCAVPG